MGIYDEIAELMQKARRKRPPQVAKDRLTIQCWSSLQDSRFVSHARPTRHFARSAGGGEEKMKYLLINFSPPFVSRFAQRSPRMANKAHVMQANADLTHDLTHNS